MKLFGNFEGLENEDFVKYAKQNKIKYIKGDENDVLSRLIKCGKKTSATDILRITSSHHFHTLRKFQNYGVIIVKIKMMLLF